MRNHLLRITLVFVAIAFFGTPSSVSARSTSDQLLLYGKDWLAGYGVDVFYPDIGPSKGEGYVEITPFCGYAYCYQCIELTTRLYAERLGYISTNGRLPDTVSIPNDLIDMINTAHEMQGLVKKGAVSVNDPEAAKFLPFADLSYTPNGGTTPPHAGDLIIYTYRIPGDHIMVVNRVAGNKIQIVQQNIWTQTRPAIPIPDRLLDLVESRGRFYINNAEGWIHSPRMENLITPASEKAYSDPLLGVGTWHWDENALTITMDRSGAHGLSGDEGQEASTRLSQQLNNAGAFAITSEPFARCALINAAVTVAGDMRFTSSFGLKGLDIRIQFTGDTLRLRPHGGKFDNQWITIPNARCGWEGNPV
jgi:hypothetical protein